MNRVVITGMGVLAPNAHGLADYEQALRDGRSGIRHHEELARLNFGCQVGGLPEGYEALKARYLAPDAALAMNAAMVYAAVAALDCWNDAGLPIPQPEEIDWDTGAIIGTGIGGAETIGGLVGPRVFAGTVRRLGSTMTEQSMASSVSAAVGGLLGLGGQVTTNSSACITGTEALIEAYYKIRDGRAVRLLAGGSESHSPLIWGCFDAMKVLAKGFNEDPARASRPMSATSTGFVPGSGAGILMLESWESARGRGARIYAEVLGGNVNSGGQRGLGSMTFPNPVGVQRCFRAALSSAGVDASEIDTINGHLTGTTADPYEVENWRASLGVPADRLPLINGTKGMIGHALGAAGGLECIASVLQLYRGFIHGSINAEDLHPELEPFAGRIVTQTIDRPIRTLAKSSFGFGDVNACILFRRYGPESL
jgi:3-oxoacyl-(acyl-carrier-protein) synthase